MERIIIFILLKINEMIKDVINLIFNLFLLQHVPLKSFHKVFLMNEDVQLTQSIKILINSN